MDRQVPCETGARLTASPLRLQFGLKSAKTMGYHLRSGYPRTYKHPSLITKYLQVWPWPRQAKRSEEGLEKAWSPQGLG